MEFGDKLQELRKSRSLTQEDLAQALYVSRTAVSKWESGRGYPSIDSLKEIARFFSVTIDDLISSDEIVVAAEGDKRAFEGRCSLLMCGMLDAMLALLLFIPAFGNGPEAVSTISLLGLSGVSSLAKAVFAIVVGVTVLCGACELIVFAVEGTNCESAKCGGVLLTVGVVLSVACVAVFIVARQPYAGIMCFLLLVTKALLLSRRAG